MTPVASQPFPEMPNYLTTCVCNIGLDSKEEAISATEAQLSGSKTVSSWEHDSASANVYLCNLERTGQRS